MGPMVEDAWKAQVGALGALIKAQRQMANLSLRELASLTNLSNAYLSQLERGLHEPSVRALRSIGDALNVSAETLLQQAGMFADEDEAAPAEAPPPSVEAAVRADPGLSGAPTEALLAVYRSYLAQPG